MKIGLMGAMPEEINALRADLITEHTVHKANREYYCGSLHGIDTVLVHARLGKVAAAITATHLISDFNVDTIIFIGVAGSADPAISIGDIVIGIELYQHDMDASPLFPKHEIPLTGKARFLTDKKLNQAIQKSAKYFLKNSVHLSKVIMGTIASGDQFIADPHKIKLLKKDHPDLSAVEMEGAAVAQVCDEHQIPLAVIRIISDNADHSAGMHFNDFLQTIASPYAAGLIRTVFPTLVKITCETTL